MVGEDRIIMSVKALRRVPVIRHAREKKITQGKTARRAGAPRGTCGASCSGCGRTRRRGWCLASPRPLVPVASVRVSGTKAERWTMP